MVTVNLIQEANMRSSVGSKMSCPGFSGEQIEKRHWRSSGGSSSPLSATRVNCFVDRESRGQAELIITTSGLRHSPFICKCHLQCLRQEDTKAPAMNGISTALSGSPGACVSCVGGTTVKDQELRDVNASANEGAPD